MLPALLVRLRPRGPWRFGPDDGARNRVDTIGHSDTLYCALSHAMRMTGKLEEWLEATSSTGGSPAVRFSSLYPFQGETLFFVPPQTLWPPPPSTRIRWKSARFVPAQVLPPLLSEKPLDEGRWTIDAHSECLVSAGSTGPFRVSLRGAAAVDRLDSGKAAPHTTACLEFTENSGMWTVFVFRDGEARERWLPAVQSTLRLLADSGLGGERSRGWGRSDPPEFREGEFPSIIARIPAVERSEDQEEAAQNFETGHWLLSLFSPAEQDTIDWGRGSYQLVVRTGRTGGAHSGGLTRSVRMIGEGSVLAGVAKPAGTVRDVRPEGADEAVLRWGVALSIPIRVRRTPAALPVPPAAPPAQPEPQQAEPAPEAEPAPQQGEPAPEMEVEPQQAEPAQEVETGEPEKSGVLTLLPPSPREAMPPVETQQEPAPDAEAREPETVAAEPLPETPPEKGLLPPTEEAQLGEPETGEPSEVMPPVETPGPAAPAAASDEAKPQPSGPEEHT
ncbi:MAG: hypothetical protein HUU41_11995 [Bryobacteraceae bacterium]|nr:hypothetical protein [Bryobacterales bacterium]NUN01828.1 hypothetical protein [Bryobacteraceae bacterium]